MKRHHWTPGEIEQLKQAYADTPTAALSRQMGISVSSIYSKAGALGLKKSQAFHNSPASGRLTADDQRGKSHRFLPGHVPANKGVKGWDSGGRSHETRFKPGQRQGRANKLYQPIGTERISKDGYLERKINDDMPFQKRWRAVHILLWEESHGPLPTGYCLIFRNGEKTDIRLDNLELISRADNMRRNTIHRYPDSLKQTIRLAGKLRRSIHEKQD